MYTAHTSALPFKDNRLWNQAPTWASTLSRTSNQFRSSWVRSKPHPKDADGSVTPTAGPWQGVAPFQAPNRKPSLLSKLTLAPATFSYLSTAFFPANISRRLDTKTAISSAYAKILARTLPAKEIPHRAGRTSLSLSLRSRGSKART